MHLQNIINVLTGYAILGLAPSTETYNIKTLWSSSICITRIAKSLPIWFQCENIAMPTLRRCPVKDNPIEVPSSELYLYNKMLNKMK